MRIRFVSLLFCSCLLATGSCQDSSTSTIDLKSEWDTSRVLENPHKGWYHHHLDNGIERYLIEDESVLDRFPGMDHLYVRLAWSFLEPEEGHFDWSHSESYSIPTPPDLVPGSYNLKIKLSDPTTAEDVDIGLKETLRDQDGYYFISEVVL